MDVCQNSVDEALSRLEALQGSDPGFFTLAVHSFIEGSLRRRYEESSLETTFNDLVNHFLEECTAGGTRYLPQYSIIKDMKTSHMLVNDVRHRFEALSLDFAHSALQQLIQFCTVADLGASRRLDAMQAALDEVWGNRTSIVELRNEAKRLKTLLGSSNREKFQLLEQLDRLPTLTKEVEDLTASIHEKDRELNDWRCRLDKKNERIETLRKERHQESQELVRMKKRLQELEPAKAYADALRKMTVLTRSRADYERLLLRLTGEQQAVVDQINLKGDFLVRGSAGTGKTLVLLKAIKKIKESDKQLTLVVEEASSAVLLTFTNALVKYNRYMASIMGLKDICEGIVTVDAFLLNLLREAIPAAKVDKDVLKNLCSSLDLGSLELDEVVNEIENFIWANDVPYQEYVVENMPRTGMGTPLRQGERMKIWEVGTQAAALMEQHNTYSFRYAVVRLLRVLENRNGTTFTRFGTILVDEVQDLPAASLKALKQVAGTNLIMAGDADQAIYRPGFSFNRAGVDIKGHARILQANFRNTVQIQALAQAYLMKNPYREADGERSSSFRDGPPPELFSAKDEKILLDSLIKRVDFFIRQLEYDPENICILVPSKEDIKRLVPAMGKAGLAVTSILDEDFDFRQASHVRISTLHSAKGLDFPIILLWLPDEPRQYGRYDQSTNELLLRNLIFVAITRAMEHCNVFTQDEPSCRAIQDLVGCFTV